MFKWNVIDSETGANYLTEEPFTIKILEWKLQDEDCRCKKINICKPMNPTSNIFPGNFFKKSIGEYFDS